MASQALTKLSLQSKSAAQDAGYVALYDLAEALKATGLAKKSLVIGGHMVSLHVERWGLSMPRLTKDSDLGTWKPSFHDRAILDSLESRGYTAVRSNRYSRKLDDLPIEAEGDDAKHEAFIDLLVPANDSNARLNLEVGCITTIEVPGLAEALNRDPVVLDLELTRLNGERFVTQVRIPDEASTLCLKALAWRRRGADKDAVDIWRGLEIALVAGVNAGELTIGDMAVAVEVIVSSFSHRDSKAMQALATHEGLSKEEAVKRFTRIKALISRVLGRKV